MVDWWCLSRVVWGINEAHRLQINHLWRRNSRDLLGGQGLNGTSPTWKQPDSQAGGCPHGAHLLKLDKLRGVYQIIWPLVMLLQLIYLFWPLSHYCNFSKMSKLCHGGWGRVHVWTELQRGGRGPWDQQGGQWSGSTSPKEGLSLRAFPLRCGFSLLFGSCSQAEFLIFCRQRTTPLLTSLFSGFCQRLLPS